MLSGLREIPDHRELFPRAVMIGGGPCCRELSISKLWQKQRQKKQAQQKLHNADYCNNLEPPVQLGIMGPRYSKIFQSQIAVLNHFIESTFSLGDCPGFFIEILYLTYTLLSCSQYLTYIICPFYVLLTQFYVQCDNTLKIVFQVSSWYLYQLRR